MAQAKLKEEAPVEESKTLVVVNEINAIQVFSENGLDPIMDAIEAEAEKVGQDISTDKNRKAIISMARKVASSKIVLENEAKALTQGWRDQTDQVNSEKKRMLERMDDLRDKIRKPVTDWEETDKLRIENHKNSIAKIEALLEFDPSIEITADVIRDRIKTLEEGQSREWEEFETAAGTVRIQTLNALKEQLDTKIKYDADQAELEKLRKEKEVREQKERDDAIAKEAADKAKADAEEKARMEAEKKQQEADEKAAKLHREKQAEKERAEKAEQDTKDAEAATAKAKADKKAAEQKAEEDAKAAKIAAKKQADDAVKAEQERVAEDERTAKIEADKREADLNHTKKINNDILKALTKGGVSEDVGKLVITLAAQGKLPHIRITY